MQGEESKQTLNYECSEGNQKLNSPWECTSESVKCCAMTDSNSCITTVQVAAQKGAKKKGILKFVQTNSHSHPEDI